MDDEILVLANSIHRDVEAIATIYSELGRHPLKADTDGDTLIVIAYHLHNLYSAFENVFQNIAAVFENSVDDVGRWRVQLLERMRLDTMPLRPAVIDDVAYDALDELRRFRHLFRHAYGVKLDPLRLQLAMRKDLSLKSMYAEQLGRFVDFMQSLMRDPLSQSVGQSGGSVMSERTGLSDDAIAVYRRTFEERERRKQAEREHHRQEALAAIRETICAVAPAYPAVQRVYVFGSITRPGTFRPDSDIDVGVEGLDAGACFDLWRDLEQAASRWTLDVRPLKPNDYFSEQVRQRGVMIYGQ